MQRLRRLQAGCRAGGIPYATDDHEDDQDKRNPSANREAQPRERKLIGIYQIHMAMLKLMSKDGMNAKTSN